MPETTRAATNVVVTTNRNLFHEQAEPDTLAYSELLTFRDTVRQQPPGAHLSMLHSTSVLLLWPPAIRDIPQDLDKISKLRRLQFAREVESPLDRHATLSEVYYFEKL